MNRIHLALLVTLIVSTSLRSFAQDKQHLKLAFYADALSNTYLEENRSMAQDSFEILFEGFLSEERSFDQSLEFLPWLSTQYSQDSSFRIITWELKLDGDQYEYFGYLQHKDGRLVRFNDRANKSSDLSYSTMDQNNWYGAKYYQVFPFDYHGETVYMLLGYDAYSRFTRRRIAETLRLTSDGVEFGVPIFGDLNEDISRTGKNRLIMEYSLEVRVLMKVETDSAMLIKDHMIPVQGKFAGQGNTWVPDGSYEGYRYTDGYWIYEEKVFNRFMEKPPMNIPAEALEKRDLFGNKRG